jgi:DNA mismatch repair protein MLH3
MTRAGLRKARIIAQLDRKFILVKMPMSREQSGSLEEEEVLVLVDQHAADERIRVEILLAELCTPLPDTEHHYRSSLGYESAVTVAVLEKPLQFSISTQEGRLFRRHGAAFATWGIMYDIDCPRSVSGKTPRNEGEMSLLSVTALPPGVSERCRADPKLLISLLRSTIWKYAEAPPRKTLTMDERQSYLGESTEESPLWVQRLPSCPQGLVDMINSRACRSAIMFNDELTIQQCEELVAILSRCAFPFMCAHGRPSMVPLISLAGGAFASGGNLGLGSSMGDDVGKKEDFRQAWKKWKQA